ncbi:MAG: aldolase/citrate lyase family protein, partial [Planctomycetota bacterium]
MRPNPVKKTLREGGTSFGTFLFEFSSTGAATVAANSGAEFVIFDMEHTGWSVETIRVLLAATRSANTIPCVRVPKSEYHFIARVLDMGAMGIMVPMVESPEEAEHIVSCTRYPPQGGKRG